MDSTQRQNGIDDASSVPFDEILVIVELALFAWLGAEWAGEILDTITDTLPGDKASFMPRQMM